MRIQHNISAINTARQLSVNDNAISKNLQRLSSGYRINSAADDAAGLAISEKMRSQINGLNQAENNAEDGISLVKTGEGNLNETTSILQRMNELAVESSNGTYQNGTDRANLNKELDALKTEIDRISTSTNFNQINLLDGSLTNEGATVTDASFVTVTNAGVDGDGTAAKVTLDLSAFDGNAAYGNTITIDGAKYQFGATGDTAAGGATLIELGANDTAAKATSASDVASKLATALSTSTTNYGVSVDGTTFTFTAKEHGSKSDLTTEFVGIDGATVSTIDGTDDTNTPAAAEFSIDFSGKRVKDLIGTTLNVNGTVYEFTTSATPTQQGNTAVNLGGVTAEDEKAGTDTAKIADAFKTAVGSSTVGVDGESWNVGGDDAKVTYTADAVGKKTVDVRHGNADGITFQIGSDATADQRVNLTVKDMSTKGLGLESISIASKQDATDAITKIKNAINTVSGTRSDFGALQNRLEHTVNNLSTTSENLTSAESRIRDVDMSSEMVEMTKNQILSQAATAMLAQANTQPQGVLQLLK